MMAALRRMFFGCQHVFEKHTDEDFSIKTKSTGGMIYPYKIRKSYLFCKKCGKISQLD